MLEMGAYEGIHAKFRHKRVIKRKSLRVFLQGFLMGAEDEARTRDPEITNHVLWPTELHRQFGPFFQRGCKDITFCDTPYNFPVIF